MIEWNIQSRADACQVCGQPFVDQQTYHTMLFDEATGYGRQDVCERCRSETPGARGAGRGELISQWRGVFELPPPRTDAIQKETAESLLRKLVEWNDPAYVAAGFILAVMLERKRVLKVKEQFQRDGRRVFIYEQPRTGDVFTIVDPALQLDQLEGVQRDVARLLEVGLPAAGGERGRGDSVLPVEGPAEPAPAGGGEDCPASPPGAQG
jgi:hypothetical protein